MQKSLDIVLSSISDIPFGIDMEDACCRARFSWLYIIEIFGQMDIDVLPPGSILTLERSFKSIVF